MGDEESSQSLFGTQNEMSLRPIAMLYSMLMLAEFVTAAVTNSNVFWTESAHLMFDTMGAWALTWAGSRSDATPVVVSIVMSSMTVMFMLSNMAHIVTLSEHINHNDEKRYSILMLAIALISSITLCVTWWVMRWTCRLSCCTGIATRTMRVHVVADVFGNVSMVALALMHYLGVAHKDAVDAGLSFLESLLLVVLSLMVISECVEWLTGCPTKTKQLEIELNALKGVKQVELVVGRYVHTQPVFDIAVDVVTIDFDMDALKSVVQEHGQVGIVQTNGLVPFSRRTSVQVVDFS